MHNIGYNKTTGHSATERPFEDPNYSAENVKGGVKSVTLTDFRRVCFLMCHVVWHLSDWVLIDIAGVGVCGGDPL